MKQPFEPACSLCGAVPARIKSWLAGCVAGEWGYICFLCVRELKTHIGEHSKLLEHGLPTRPPVFGDETLATIVGAVSNVTGDCTFGFTHERQKRKLLLVRGFQICDECLDRCEDMWNVDPDQAS